MISSLLLMNRFSTAETSQDQGHNIIFNLSCNISEQASQVVAVLSCVTLCSMLRGAVMCSVQGKYFLKEFCMARLVKLAQVAQRGGTCPIPGNLQGQVGQGSEQPGLVKDEPAHCRQAVEY